MTQTSGLQIRGNQINDKALLLLLRVAQIIFFTLAISKCYGKVRVLFFLATSLVSARKSHSSSVRGLVIRSLLFNPEGSCSNPCICANFYKYSEADGSHFFRHYETSPPPFRLWRLFFETFQCPQRGPLHFF